MEWWQILLVALTTFIVTKAVDFFIDLSKEKRNFHNLRRAKMLDEIEAFKDEVGRFYELASNWKSHEMKVEQYQAMMIDDDRIIGKYNEYPRIAVAGRDLIHWCKIVAYFEREPQTDLIKAKKELSEKYKVFIEVCNEQLDVAA
jgi:hypothetical protein